ncbi:MAG: MBL fold metallo-hydrolase, partial [candidate division WOR-3 bacterium]
MANFEISFHGASGTVTGSCFLLRYDGLNILIDCGLFQGGEDEELLNYSAFGFDPREVDYLVLTHGHLDHVGRLPLLVKEGFKGKIICTDATFDIARVVLVDAARIKSEDYKRMKKIAARKGGPLPPPPLYSVFDVMESFKYFVPIKGYRKGLKLKKGVELTFYNAGHILGSAFVEFKLGDSNIVFSGDLGNSGKLITPDPSLSPYCNFLVVESTYGDREHRSFEESIVEFKNAINETIKSGGNVIIPAFAIERAQEVIYLLKILIEKGEVPKVKVFLDSPMASEVINIMRKHRSYLRKELLDMMDNGYDPFDFPGLEITEDIEDSKSINSVSGTIIIAGSGMCNGGRILHHLKHNIWKEESSIVFVGFQAKGTLGREIVDGSEEVEILGSTYKVKARVYTINGFSSHIGQ